mgnify:CR=1 FL=1
MLLCKEYACQGYVFEVLFYSAMDIEVPQIQNGWENDILRFVKQRREKHLTVLITTLTKIEYSNIV